jgi:hypothetical protein
MESDRGAILTAVVFVFALLIVVGLVVKLIDLKRKREAEAVHLQAQVSDALLRDERLFGLPITATAYVPTWRRGPATVDVSGQVPTPELRETALRIVEHEVARVRSDVRIESRIGVVPTMSTRAA